MSKKEHICIIGPLSPPIGGVSIYLERYSEQLDQQQKKHSIYSFNKRSFLYKIISILNIIFNPKFTTILVNSSNKFVLSFLIFRIFPCKLIYFDHNFRLIEDLNWFQKFLFRGFMRRVNEFWYVEEKVLDYYTKYNIRIPHNHFLKNAFIVPDDPNYVDIFFSKNVEVAHFIDSHNPIIASTASSFAFYKGVDLYGIDLLIKTLSVLIIDFPQIGLIIAIGAVNNKKYYQSILAELGKHTLFNNTLILLNTKEIWPIFQRSNLMLRPTFTDGDALSIREALHFKCQVIASNCCKRPEGVVTFENRDLSDLINKTKHILNQIAI
jgi:glycosyltransferase involved in cell wall biosynthesis